MNKFDEYKTQRVITERAEAEYKTQFKVLKAIESRMLGLMDETQVKSVPTEDGLTFGKRRHYGFSNTEENREEIRMWLCDTIGDDAPYMEQVVSRTALRELIKDGVENSGKTEESFPQFLNVSLTPIAVVTGWKKFKQQKQETTQ